MTEFWSLPDGWQWKTVASICGDSERRNPAAKQHEYFQYVDIGAIDNDQGLIRPYKVQSILGSEAPSRARKVIETNDVIFATTRPYLRNIAVVPQELNDQICSTGFCVLRSHPDRAIPQYVYYACRSQFFIEQLAPRQRGATYPAVADGDVYAASIPVPYPDDPARSLAEQRRIVVRIEALFAELRECRALQQAIVDDTGRLMEAVLAEVFAAENVETWEYVDSLDQLVEINAPLVAPTDSRYRDLPHINGEVIEEGTGRLLAYRSASEDRMRSAKYLFKPGSVLYSKIRPYLRKAAIVDFGGLCSADMYPLELKNTRLTREFLRWMLLSPHFTNYANSVSGRARMPKINRSQLFDYQMRYPSWPEQMRITGLLEAMQVQIGEMKAVEHSDSNLLLEMEQAILAQAFRGEL